MPFTTQRMLIGDFTAAAQALKQALKEIAKGRILPIAPHLLIQPLEMIEGGLGQLEERIIREIALGAGASRVVVWGECCTA